MILAKDSLAVLQFPLCRPVARRSPINTLLKTVILRPGFGRRISRNAQDVIAAGGALPPCSRLQCRDVKEHCYSVYIMSSRTKVLYVGITSDLQHRVSEHKTGALEGFTNKYKCHYLVHFERYDNVFHAIGREKQLKGWTRAKKIALIESSNPRWQDRSEHWGRQILFPAQSKAEADAIGAARRMLKIPGSS